MGRTELLVSMTQVAPSNRPFELDGPGWRYFLVLVAVGRSR